MNAASQNFSAELSDLAAQCDLLDKIINNALCKRDKLSYKKALIDKAFLIIKLKNFQNTEQPGCFSQTCAEWITYADGYLQQQISAPAILLQGTGNRLRSLANIA